MSRVLKVSQSNYRLQTATGGTITLDTGVDVGTVIVTGDLVVQGETTTVNTTNLAIEDNIIVLNKNQTGNGITLASPISGRAGIEINRGNRPAGQLLFDENVNHYDFPNTTNEGGTFVLKTNDGKKAGLQDGLVKAVSRARGSMWGNIVFGGGVGALIDHSKGTGYAYPDQIQVIMGKSRTLDRDGTTNTPQ